MGFTEDIKNVLEVLASGFVEETIQSNQETFLKIKEIYNNDPSGFLDVVQFAQLDFKTLVENAMEIPDSDKKHIVEHIVSGLYEHFHKMRIEKLEGSSCCADKSGFIQDMTLKAIKENTNFSLYADYSKIEHMKDKYRGRAYWSPTSIKDTDEAIELFWKWYQLNDKSVELTTGEMIDQLQVGQVAERIYEPIGVCSDRYTHARVDDYDGELMFYCEQHESWEYDRLTGSLISSKWIIKGAITNE